jgi:hypothetical protein
MSDSFDKWGRDIGSDGGAETFDKWGRDIAAKPSGGGGGGGNFLSDLTGDISNLATGVGQGVYGLGRAIVMDASHQHDPGQPYHSHIVSDVAVPIGHAYSAKYAPIVEHPLTGSSYRGVRADPFGTILDLLGLGTIPFGGEGLAIRGAATADRLGAADTAIGRTLARAAVKAGEARAPRTIHYSPNEAEGGTFTAPRARTVQGRLVYNPAREAVGRSFGGQLPLVGDASRLARYMKAERELRIGAGYAQVSEFQRALSGHLRASKQLSRAERLALPIMAEYGPRAARDAELGVPREQRVAYYTDQLARTKQALEDPGLGKAKRTRLREVARAQQRIVKLLGDAKLGRRIDKAVKSPRPVAEQVLDQARALVDAHGESLEQAGLLTPEIAAERALLPQRLMTGAEYRGSRTIGYEQAPATYQAARQEYEAALRAPAGGPKGEPDRAIQEAWQRGVEQAQRGLEGARTRPGPKRPIETEAGFYGGTPVDKLRAAHEDAFLFPHVGPRLPRDHGLPGSSWRGGNPTPGGAKLNRGIRFSTGQLVQGPEAWVHARLRSLKYDLLGIAREQLRHVAVPYDGLAGSHPLRDGYVPVNLDGARLTRAQQEAAAFDEHFRGLSEKDDHRQMIQALDEMFPPAVHGETRAAYQVPEIFVRKVRTDFKRANAVVRWIIDKPLVVWKTLVLGLRPAFLVNNVVGQHLLYLLHNPLNWRDYVDALKPTRRAELARAIPGLLGHGTSDLLGHDQAAADAGYAFSRRGQLKGGSILHGEEGRGTAGIVGQAAYRSVSYPARIVSGIRNSTYKLNLELADNTPRAALATRYLREEKRALRAIEIANGAVESAVKGKSLEQVAAELSETKKLEILRKVNSAVGDFNALRGSAGRTLRRIVPFAAWMKVVLEITRDLAVDHPEKLALVNNLELAARQNPGVVPQLPLPSWLQGSIIAAGFSGNRGEQPVLTTQALNPFQTPLAMFEQAGSLFRGGVPSGTENPLSSLGPAANAIDLAQGIDPFLGGSYTGPGANQSPLVRASAGTFFSLPQARLAQAWGLLPYYKPPASYHDRYSDTPIGRVPEDALLRFLGLPIRRVDRAKAAQYAAEGR